MDSDIELDVRLIFAGNAVRIELRKWIEEQGKDVFENVSGN